ncbi:nuclear transport factor 2 family protein [Actinoplanes sp. NPDC049596]|uniref:nuclear transport factor 2 family protein n=1 Tax=unclassified Actinoplanes TaxID=2626549 RepID=UPI0034391F3C
MSEVVHPFRAAVESGDINAAIALLDDDVVFHSPVVHKPYRGRATVAEILRAVVQVFEDFRYVREISTPGALDHALVFRARVGDRDLEGCDFIHQTADGRIDELTVMVRPLSATLALAEAMQARLAQPTQPAQ